MVVDMAKLQQQVEQLIQPIVENMGYVLWGCELHSSGRYTSLRVYIDIPNNIEHRGVTIDDCGRVSNQISAVLDVEDLIANSYTLEVSSPGLDRALYKLEHYQQYLGSMVKVSLLQSMNGRRHLSGKILALDGANINMLVDNELFQVPFANIKNAHLVPNFQGEGV